MLASESGQRGEVDQDTHYESREYKNPDKALFSRVISPNLGLNEIMKRMCNEQAQNIVESDFYQKSVMP